MNRRYIRNITSRRTAASVLCLVAFVAGGLVAPASHFVFMSVSDAYGHDIAVHGESSREGAGHHTSTPRPSHTGPVVEGHSTAHELCEYADLFASFAPNFISDDQAIGQLDEASFVFPVLDGPTATGLLSTSLARGPPSA